MSAKSGNFLRRLGLFFKAGKAVLARPRLASAILHENAYWESAFRKKYGHTRPLPVVSIDEFVPSEAELPVAVFLGGSSTIPDLLLLKHLAAREDVNTYFEIGGWRGESLSAILPFVKKAYSLDLDEAGMDTRRYTQQMRKQLYVLTHQDERVIRLKGDSAQFRFSEVGEKIDLVFIDGSHGYEYVLSDTLNVLKHLVHEKSIIVWHDYANDPEQVRWEVYHAIVEAVPESRRTHLYHVSHTKCAILWPFGALPCQPAEFPMTVNDLWKVSISKLNGR